MVLGDFFQYFVVCSLGEIAFTAKPGNVGCCFECPTPLGLSPESGIADFKLFPVIFKNCILDLENTRVALTIFYFLLLMVISSHFC